MKSPYTDIPKDKWIDKTIELTNSHPLKDEIVQIVTESWNTIFKSSIGGFRIGIDIFPEPQIMGFFLHTLIALFVHKKHPEYKLGDSTINLFPFTPRAITFLYKKQDTNMRHPRALMREILEPYLKHALDDIKNFPKKRSSIDGMDTTLQNAINNRNDLHDNTKIRLTQFMYIWGDGTNNVYTKKGIRYIGGIADSVYEQLDLPIFDGKKVEIPDTDVSLQLEVHQEKAD